MEDFWYVWVGFGEAGISQGWLLTGRHTCLSGLMPDSESRWRGSESGRTEEGRLVTTDVEVQVLVSVVLTELQGNSCPDTLGLKTNTELPVRDSSLHLQSLQVCDHQSGDLLDQLLRPHGRLFPPPDDFQPRL